MASGNYVDERAADYSTEMRGGRRRRIRKRDDFQDTEHVRNHTSSEIALEPDKAICLEAFESTQAFAAWLERPQDFVSFAFCPNVLQALIVAALHLMLPTGNSSDMVQGPIVILGAGIGGLTLGRCLLKKGISSVIYEKASSSPRYKYGITLEPRAYRPLLRVLNLDEHDLRRQTAVDSLAHGTGQLFFSNSQDSEENLARLGFRALRSRFEEMLREGLDIKFEHALSSVNTLGREIGGQSSVELCFQDGSKVRSSLVIDTLGVHSQLRHSLLPKISLNILPYAVFSGKRYIPQDLFESSYAPALDGGNMLVRAPTTDSDLRLEVSVNEHLAEGRVSISYVYSRPVTIGPKPDPVFDPERPLSGATNIPEAFYSELEAFRASTSLEQPFLDVFDPEKIRNERLLNWLMRTVMVPKGDLRNLLDMGIVMIGDSVHAPPILGGHGANSAILDAVSLAETIGEDGTGPDVLRRFYGTHWQRWNDEITASKEAIAKMHAVKKAS